MCICVYVYMCVYICIYIYIYIYNIPGARSFRCSAHFCRGSFAETRTFNVERPNSIAEIRRDGESAQKPRGKCQNPGSKFPRSATPSKPPALGSGERYQKRRPRERRQSHARAALGAGGLAGHFVHSRLHSRRCGSETGTRCRRSLLQGKSLTKCAKNQVCMLVGNRQHDRECKAAPKNEEGTSTERTQRGRRHTE